MSTEQRRAEIAAGLADVRGRIDAAAREAGRDPDTITLIVVTKTFPASDVQHLCALGVRDVGENRHPEAERKAAELAELTSVRPTWHFVGQVQSNKAARIATYADVVHSVDSGKVVERLNRGAAESRRRLTVLVQVSVDAPDPGAGATADRGGVAPDDVSGLADQISAAEALDLGGLMAVAPLAAPPAQAFARLAEIAARLRAVHPEAAMLSAGMSGDFEEAIRFGATHVRVGSAVLGGRPLLG